jgi:hypothetical protein
MYFITLFDENIRWFNEVSTVGSDEWFSQNPYLTRYVLRHEASRIKIQAENWQY